MSVKNSSSSQQQIRYQFESFCKKVIRNERYDYLQSLLRHAGHETNFSALSSTYLTEIESMDSYSEDSYVFHVCGYHISLQNGHLVDALLELCAEERSILILYYCLDLKDHEIARLFRTSRSRIQRLRTKAFHQLQEEMRR